MKIVGVGVGIGIEGNTMSFGHERLDVYRVAIEAADYAKAGIDSDTDADSDPAGAAGASPLPERGSRPPA